MTISWRKTLPNMKMRGLALWLIVLSTLLAARSGETAKEARVVCYYTNWSVYRPGTAKFNPQNINPYLCTHLIYAFGGFTKENTLKPFDKYQDIEKGGYAKFTGLKTYNPNLKTMIAIGGWNEGSSRFSALVASPERRREFVKNSIKFLRQNKFDGLDLDWEYPSFRDGGKPKDKGNYAKLVQELREEFEKESSQTGRPRLLLTMAVPAGVEYIDKGYDVPKLNRYLDWMNLLSYDYHSAFEPSVNHHSPLYPLEEASEYNFESDLNIDFTIKRYMEAGAEPEKIVLGIPTYGRSFTLFNPDSNAIGAPADGPGEQGDATREKGYLAYYEICESLMPKARSKRETDSDEYEDEDEEWTVVQPNPRALGPYAFKGNQWVGYDDIDIVRKKAEYVAKNNLGGIMFWSIDNDDFRGKCHNKPYPLIEAAKESLYKSLGITESVAPSKKPTSTRKRPRPSKPSKASDSSEEKDKNSIKGSKKDSEPESKYSKTSSERRRQNLARRSSSTTESSPISNTPAWGLNTPEPPTTPDPGSDFKCVEEGFFPHPRDCKKYFWCLESGPSNLGIVAHQFTCPSGLHFNKAADSCDFARNVLCNKKKPAVTSAPPASTTKAYVESTSSSTTTTTSRPSQLSGLFTSRRPSPKITAATSSTTLLSRGSTTTPSAIEEEYEDEEELDEIDDLPTSEEDPKVIKELVDLIKKLGGVEQLEKYLSGSPSSNVQGSITTTPATISRLLYERVLSQARPQNERAPPQQNSRGPQSIGPIDTDDNKNSNKRGRPQYTTINRQRTPSSTTEKVEDQSDEEEEGEEEESRIASSSTSRPGLPQYVNIRRVRPSTQEPESTSRYSTIDRNPENNSQEDEDRNVVQNKDYSSIFRPSAGTNDATTSKYKTIQRVRSTTTQTTPEVNNLEINNVVVQGSEDQINPDLPSILSSPAALVTESRNQFSDISPVVETTTLNDRNNDIDDLNVEIASPSFTSENGIITNTGSSTVLNAQITTLSNTPKPIDENNDTTITNPISYSTKVTITEEVSSSTQRSSPLFAKRTRPTTTTVKPQEQSEQIPDNKVSLDRNYGNIKRTRVYPSSSLNNSSSSSSLLKARLRNEISSDTDKDLVNRIGKSDVSLGETNDTLVKLNGRPGTRKIRSTTPASQENQDETETEQAETDYGNKRFVRPQLRFTARKLNSKSNSDEDATQNADDSQSPITSNGENGVLIRNRPTIAPRNSGAIRQPNNRLRKFFGSEQTRSNIDNESSSNEFIPTEVSSTTNPTRSTPSRRFRPNYSSFESDLSSLTSIDSTKRRYDNPEPSSRYRNAQVNRRFRPSFGSSTTNQPLDDSDESDSSITPVVSDRQRSFGFRGGNRFTTVKPTLDNTESNSDVSESSIPPRARKFNIARFSPRPFSFSTPNVEENSRFDDLDLEDEDENELNTESPFDAKLLGKARLSAPVINISQEDKSPTSFKIPSVPSTLSSQQSINVTKVINSNILLGQSNNRSGILLLRRPSTSTLPTKISSTTSTPVNEDEKVNDIPFENIHLSETTIEEKEQDEESNVLVSPERPRKRIIVKKLRSTTASEALTTEATTVEDKNDAQDAEVNKDDDPASKQRIRKVLRRRPATTTSTTTEESINNKIQEYTDKPELDDAKGNQTTAIPRVRKIIRRKLKPILTDEGKTRLLQTKNEDINEEVKDENEIRESSSVSPLFDLDKSTTENVQIDLLTEQTTFTSSSTRSKVERPSYRPIKRPINILTSTEPSTTTAKTYSRKYINGPFTTPTTPDRDPNIFVDKPRIETNPRRPTFGSRPFSKRPFTTARTTTANEDEYENVDDEFEEEEEEEPNKLVFVPVDQLFTRGPTGVSINNIAENPAIEDNVDINEEDVDKDEEEEVVDKVIKPPPPVIKLGNRFNSPQPPLVQGRGGLAIGRETNRPTGFNRPSVVVKPANEEASKRFNRPVAFQPNRSNRPGFSSTSAPTEATSKYVRKFVANRPVTEITPTSEGINIENVNNRHKQLFGNPKRFSSTTFNPLDDITEDSTLITTDYAIDTTTDVYDATEISTDPEIYSTTEESTTIVEEMTTIFDIKEEVPTTEKPKIETHVFSVENTNKTDDVEENTVFPFYNVTTTTEKVIKNVEPSIRTTSLLDKLFEVSRVVEVTSTQEKHRFNRKNESRLIERGEVIQEKKPTLDKIGEVSRFTLIKIVERDIPIYLTNLSHEYPVANPPINPIRIDEARNARALNNFSDSGKENLIASESVNSAYNHRNALIDIIDAPAYSEHLHKQFTSHSLNKTAVKPQIVDEKFASGSITPRSVLNETSTLAIEGLFNVEESSLYSARQANETGSKAFVVYAAPKDNITEISNDNSSDSDRVPSGRSLTNYVKIQVLRPDEESSKIRNKEFFGVPAAVDVMHEKENPLSKQPFKISILNQEDENKTIVTTAAPVSEITKKIVTDTTTILTTTTTTTTTTTEEPTTTPLDSSIVKIKTATITNNTLTKIAKKRPKLTFPRRPQSQLKASNITRLSIIPNRAANVTVEGKNIPFTTPKYNRTNSYTSGRSRFSAIRSQNVPVDPRKPDVGKSKAGSSNSTSDIIKVSTLDANKKIAIKPLRPGLLRGSTFSPRRTTLPPSQEALEATTLAALSDVSASENTIKSKVSLDSSSDQNKVGFRPKPAFFPRRSSSRFTTKFERSTSTASPKDADTTPTPAKRRLALERRRPTSLPTTTRDSTEGAGTTRAPNTRPTRLFVRKYTGPRSGTSAATTTTAPITKPSENTSRKNFRIGIRKRPSFGIAKSSQSTTIAAIDDVTTVTSTTKIDSDQEYHSTTNQAKENSQEIPEKRRVKIQKRPLTNAFKFNTDDSVKTDDKQTSDKIYSSVIKEDQTLVQQEKTVDTSKNEVKYNSQNVEDVTADVAVVAHQLLSAPLPTIPSYSLDDQSNSDNTDTHLFTRAYLLASSASPIVSNDEYVSTSIRPQYRFTTPVKSRRISTTVAPLTVSTIRSLDQRRKPQYKEEFQKIEPIIKHYRQFVDYEYYDDDDVRIVGKTPTQGKVIVHGKGRIQCLDQGNFPHPESCKKFISCARMENGEVYGWAYTCPAGLSFDPVGGICNWSSGLGCSD